MNTDHDKILIVDFGSQVTQLIARRVREEGVYCEIVPFTKAEAAFREQKPKGVILSGGPESVTVEASPRAPQLVFDSGVPVFGICYGQQTMAAQLGGAVEGGHHAEFGRAEVERGEFTFEGRRYQITRGTIDFNNPTRIQPFFDIETETRVRVPGQTYRVIARAAGTMDRLTPTFEADPPLQEVEVLALLLSDVAPGRDVEFRRYRTNITPQQELLRERATRALTDTVTSEVGRVVEQAFGVDTFQLTPSLVDPNTQSSRLDPAARLTIGKRLSERIYLTYSRSLSASTRGQIILLEYDQTDRFAWILSRNEDRTYALDVRVRHSF